MILRLFHWQTKEMMINVLDSCLWKPLLFGPEEPCKAIYYIPHQSSFRWDETCIEVIDTCIGLKISINIDHFYISTIMVFTSQRSKAWGTASP